MEHKTAAVAFRMNGTVQLFIGPQVIPYLPIDITLLYTFLLSADNSPIEGLF